MITSQGYGVIAELIATALLIAALTGFFVQRSKPWQWRELAALDYKNKSPARGF
jgi:hypothetical protein